MKNYQITIGYRAVICVQVKAKNESDAKELALKKFTKQRDKIRGGGVEVQDDNFKADGVLDMDATWGMYDKNFKQ